MTNKDITRREHGVGLRSQPTPPGARRGGDARGEEKKKRDEDEGSHGGVGLKGRRVPASLACPARPTAKLTTELRSGLTETTSSHIQHSRVRRTLSYQNGCLVRPGSARFPSPLGP
jgi:hypothetical protein